MADYLTLAAGFGARDAQRRPRADHRPARASFTTNLVTDATRPGVRPPGCRTLLAPALHRARRIDRQPGDEPTSAARCAPTVIGALGATGDDPRRHRAARGARSIARCAGRHATARSDVGQRDRPRGRAARRSRAVRPSRAAAAAATSRRKSDYRYLYALTAIQDPALSQLALDVLAVTRISRRQDTALYLARFLANPAVNRARGAS